MIEKIISFLHITPLVIILLLTISNKVLKLVSNKFFDLSPFILLLSSIGVASGFKLHHYGISNTFIMCYTCFAYSLILVMIGFKLMGERRSISSNNKKTFIK